MANTYIPEIGDLPSFIHYAVVSSAPGNGTGAGAPPKKCTEVSQFCPVTRTILGYAPHLGANITFAVGFSLFGLIALALGVKYKTWSFSLPLFVGGVVELLGYIGRLMLHHNAWNASGFKLQICTLITGPSIFCMSIYLTLKHSCLAVNPRLSRIPAHLYPLIFVPCDMLCLIVQGTGGGLAAGNIADKNLTKIGGDVILAGTILQVAVLTLFAVLSIDFFVRARSWIKSIAGSTSETDVAARAHWNNKKFWIFQYAVWAAFFFIFVRCVYRIIEMNGGWGNHVMQDEAGFIALEGACILAAAICLTVFTPGILFPQLSKHHASGVSSFAGDMHRESGQNSSHSHLEEKTGPEPRANSVSASVNNI